MIKRYYVTCEVNMCAEKVINQIVKANTQRKAEEFAIKKLYKEGYFNVILISCEEMKGNEHETVK